MRSLSNFFRRGDAGGAAVPAPAPGPVPRVAAPSETDAAVRQLLSGDTPADNTAVADFQNYARQRGIFLGDLRVIDQGGIVWAVLPVTGPGRTLLLIVPPRMPPLAIQPPVQQLLEELCSSLIARANVAQILLEPELDDAAAFYRAAGFQTLAELLYLQRNVPAAAAPDLPPHFRWETYNPATHHRFARTIEQSYVGSLDCPALEGLRTTDDVILGHQATGDFNPNLWFLLSENERPLGVLLLNPTLSAGSLELVYLGLVPTARGRGLGDLMMRQALYVAGREKLGRFATAVDARNIPALKLYYRHGTARFSSRLALVRRLGRSA